MSEIWSAPMAPSARATRSACVKFSAARMSRSASPPVSADASTWAIDRAIAPPRVQWTACGPWGHPNARASGSAWAYTVLSTLSIRMLTKTGGAGRVMGPASATKRWRGRLGASPDPRRECSPWHARLPHLSRHAQSACVARVLYQGRLAVEAYGHLPSVDWERVWRERTAGRKRAGLGAKHQARHVS